MERRHEQVERDERLKERWSGWLTKRIREMGMNQSTFARAAGLDPSAVSRYARKLDRPRHDKIVDIARALKVEPAVVMREAGLAGDDGPNSPLVPEGTPDGLRRQVSDAMVILQHVASQVSDVERWRAFSQKMRRVPVYRVEASADVSRSVLNDPAGDRAADELYLPAAWFSEGERPVSIRVVGNCMEPHLKEGEEPIVVFGRPAQPGQIVLAAVGDALHIKRLMAAGDGLLLVPEDGGEPIPVDDGVHILAPVLGAFRRY